MVLVLLNDALGILVGVERVHEDEGYVDFVLLVQVFDLSDGEVEEGHPFTDFDSGFGCTTPDT